MIARKPEILLCFGLCLVTSTKRPLLLAAKSPRVAYSPGSLVSHSLPGVGNGATTVKRTWAELPYAEYAGRLGFCWSLLCRKGKECLYKVLHI